jgi:hypothetical protein
MKGRMVMRFKSAAYLTILILLLLGTAASADQIVLKDGSSYSGTFVRGDSDNIEFRVLGNIFDFKIENVTRINFGDSDTKPASASRSAAEVNLAKGVPPDMESSATVPANIPEKPKAYPIVAGPRMEKKAEPQLMQRPAQKESAKTMRSAGSEPVTLPSGALIVIRTTTAIDTDRNRAGDPFDAILDEDLMSDEKIVAPRGSAVKGRIAYAKESGKLTGQSQLILELTELTVKNKFYLLRTSDYTEVGANRGTRTAQTVGGVAAVGAIIGAIAGGGKGAAIGAASGAAVGTGVQVVTKGQTLKVPAETILEFRLQYPLTID